MARNLREENIEMIKHYIQDGAGEKEIIIEYAKTLNATGFNVLIDELKKSYDGFVEKSVMGEYPVFEINEHGDEERDISELYTELAKLDNAPIDKLADCVISSQDIYWIYVFARDIEGAPVDKLANALLQLLNEDFYDTGVLAEYIFYFANDVRNAPVNNLAYALLAKEEVFKDSEACGYLDEFSEIASEPLATLLKIRYQQAKEYHGDNDEEFEEDEIEDDFYDESDFPYNDFEI